MPDSLVPFLMVACRKNNYMYTIIELATSWILVPKWVELRAMTYTFFNQKFDNGTNEGLRWFGINLMVSFQDITQNMFCNLAKFSHPTDLESC